MASPFPSLSHIPSAFPLPTIAEDTLHYVIHLPPSSTALPTDPSATALLITQHVNSLLPQPWLWNKDSWELKVVESEGPGVGDGLGAQLEGRMRVGDAVDDEWLVVWLLKEVSKKWEELIISIRDTDGEFLLIEAANELPPWVSPENAENRLWLQAAHLHLLPLTIRSTTSAPRQLSDTDDFSPTSHLSTPDALRAVRTGRYRASSRMEDAVWARVNGYPGALSTHVHRTKAYLPVGVAKALKERSELVQKAVEGFYVRDPSQLRAASRMTHFPPSASVLTQLTLTRAAYAQLQGQVFHPPRIFGPEWHVRDASAAGDDSGAAEKLEGERRWRDIGVKVATGFEIMYREGGKKGRGGAGAGVDAEEGGETMDEGYGKFLENLKGAGWFGDEMEGSQKWKEREGEAKRGYIAVKAADTAAQRPSFAYLVDSAIASSTLTPEQLAAPPDAQEDPEDWLEISPDELDDMMLRASGRGAASAQGGGEEGKRELGEEDGQALQDLAKKVEEFVGGQGDLEGARFMDELSDDDMDSGSEDDEEEEKEKLEKEKQERLDKLVPSLPASDWGRKASTSESATTSCATSTPATSTAQPAPPPARPNPADFIPSSMRPPRFAKQEYDGVVSDSDSDSDGESGLPPVGTLGRKIAEMKWSEGAGPGDTSEGKSARIEEIGEDEEEEEAERERKLALGDDADLEEEMQRRVWGGGDDDADMEDAAEEQGEVQGEGEDVDMEDETEEFLKFSREALGITDEMWEGILGDRRARGAFVPSPAKGKPQASADPIPEKAKPKASAGAASAGKKVQFASSGPTPAPELPLSQESGKPNASLDSFDTVMRAMDDALSRPGGSGSAPHPTPAASSKPAPAKPPTTAPAPRPSTKKPSSSNALPSETTLDDFSEDDLLAMDRELREVLKGAGVDPDAFDDEDEDGEPEEAGELEGEQRREYEMMRDFLESYKSQGGGSGVVGNLFGRLGGAGL
ncbi:hypothetical protein IAT38_002487 [Cryptococcus sp. DSM 104549]